MSLLLLALLLSLIASFLLSGLEAALFSASLVRVRHRAKDAEHHRAKENRLERLLANRARLLTAVLFTNNAIALGAFAVGAKILIDRFGDRGYWITFLVSLPIYILWFELVPKALFSRFPYRALRTFVFVLEIVDITVGRLLGLLTLLKPALREEGERIEDELDDRARARSEFRSLAKIITRDGAMAKSEKEMIESVMNFRRTTVGELMVPISAVTAIPIDMPATQVVQLSKQTGLEEFPVMSKGGELIGIVSAFEILISDNGEESGAAVNYLHRLVKTTRSEPAASLIPQLRKAGLRVAAVCDSDKRRTSLGIIHLDQIFATMLRRR